MIDFSAIQDSINRGNLESVKGGWSMARRGIVRLPDDSRVFVKIGTDERTVEHANREIEIYMWLNSIGFMYAPKLISFREGAYAIDDLSNFEFSDSWNSEKFNAVFKACDELNKLMVPESLKRKFKAWGSWEYLLKDESLRNKFILKIGDKFEEEMLDNLEAKAIFSADFVANGSVAMHCDLRGDNIAYNGDTGSVMIIDWDCFCLFQPGSDTTELLVSAKRNGINIDPEILKTRVNKDICLFFAGYWFSQCVMPIWQGGDSVVRDHQLESGLIAWNWYKTLCL